jgi:hypothetical protein
MNATIKSSLLFGTLILLVAGAFIYAALIKEHHTVRSEVQIPSFPGNYGAQPKEPLRHLRNK